MDRRSLVAIVWVVVLAVFAVQSKVRWDDDQRVVSGADFASYYFAAKVAQEGGNPYRPRQLRQSAKGSSRGGAVHPFFYPPPFLALVWWAPQLDLSTAYQVWWGVNLLCGLLCFGVLARWWRALGTATPLALAALLVTFTALPNNLTMGQANLPVMALALGGLWLADEDRPWLGGVLMGAACMFKMSPALFVAWWLLRWRWREVAAACGTAVVLSVLSLPMLSLDLQIDFYVRVLPAFADGRYNGLTVPIAMFGNHSIPNLIHQVVGGPSLRLAPLSSSLSSVASGTLLVGLTTAFWWNPPDALARHAQVAAVGGLMLLIPVYTYEHHMVWIIPAMVVCIVAQAEGRLPATFAPFVAAAVVAQCFPIWVLRELSEALGRQHLTLFAFALQEAKFAALLVFSGGTAYLGASGWRERLLRSEEAEGDQIV